MANIYTDVLVFTYCFLIVSTSEAHAMRKWASSHQIKPFVVTSNVTEGSEVFFIFFFFPQKIHSMLSPILTGRKTLVRFKEAQRSTDL